MFIGDSITAGYGVNGEQSDTVFTTKTEDVTKAYPYLTAKEVSADPWYVCWSGGGIISRWIPPETELPLTDILMPELFETGKDLDFIPGLISINLGTNDASYTRDDEGRKEKFGARYLAFVRRISEVYPDTPNFITVWLDGENVTARNTDSCGRMQQAGSEMLVF